MIKSNTKDTGAELQKMGSRIDPVIDELFPESAGDFLTDAFRHHMGTGGKRIRPALCLLSCRELGGDMDNALAFAAAVEILHNMFLVHDDLEDGDRIRRNEPAVWVKYGAANAVNLGDYMLGRAYSAILSSPVDPEKKCRLLALFTATYESTCRGQALDLNWRGRDDMDVERYIGMVQLKTADYLVLGMMGGAVIADASDSVLSSLKRLGSLIGPAFQIRDDVIDLTSGKGRGGELGNDIREGKPSILFAHALGNTSGADRRFLLSVTRKTREETTPDDVQKVIALYKRCGSISFATGKADELTRNADAVVDEIPVENKDFFRQIVHYMAERTA